MKMQEKVHLGLIRYTEDFTDLFNQILDIRESAARVGYPFICVEWADRLRDATYVCSVYGMKEETDQAFVKRILESTGLDDSSQTEFLLAIRRMNTPR
jgi:hypothetical protein